MSIRLAFDIGGTFTDLVLEDRATGRTQFWKTLSTPSAPEVAVIQGISELLTRTEVAPSDVSMLLHATTVATNAILERKGTRTALITTKGFRDILLLGRQKRYQTYNLYLAKPEPLIRRRDIFELDERIFARDREPAPPNIAEIDSLLDHLSQLGYESVAVCLLHAYRDPTHERLVAERAEAKGLSLALSLSSDVSPRYREYERTSTVVANAYVKPIVANYVRRLETALSERGIGAELYIMQSNGGLVSPELAAETPVRIVESGPAAGVLMCREIGEREGIAHLLTFDMGGTTAKLGAIDDGEPAILSTFEVDQAQFVKGSGLPLNISSIELLEIGAGGGSIANVDLGVIRVGPQSAGSEPGPACYGRGGAQPTVTDANLLLGYYGADSFGGGEMALDLKAAETAVTQNIANPIGLSTIEAAWGIHIMATANMERALRIMSVERGRDPRKYALVGFGGAGPVHAARLARNLGIPKLIIPRGAGVGSALGLLGAELKVDHALTRQITVAPGALAAIRAVRNELLERVEQDLTRLSPDGARRTRLSVAARYQGQGYEVDVDVPDLDVDEHAFVEAFEAAFAAAYRRTYSYDFSGRPIEAVDWTLHAVVDSRDERKPRLNHTEGSAPKVGSRSIWLGECGGFVDVAVYSREYLAKGEPVLGPCIVEEAETTTVLLPGDKATITVNGNLVVYINAAETTS